MTADLQPAAPHGATDPCRTRWRWSGDDASAVVKVLRPGWVPGTRAQARKESNPRSSGLEAVTPPWLKPKQEMNAHDGVRVLRGMLASSARSAAPYQRLTGLPTLAASRRSGVNSLSSREPGWHAYAPTLDRAWPWSVRSAV